MVHQNNMQTHYTYAWVQWRAISDRYCYHGSNGVNSYAFGSTAISLYIMFFWLPFYIKYVSDVQNYDNTSAEARRYLEEKEHKKKELEEEKERKKQERQQKKLQKRRKNKRKRLRKQQKECSNQQRKQQSELEKVYQWLWC